MTTISQELTLAERARRQELEATISRGWRTFIQVGEALEEIRAKRLYREDFASFEEYCQKVWNWSRQRAYQMMDGAKTARTLEEVGVQVSNEKQARELKPVAQAVAAAPVAQRKSVFEETMQKAMTLAPAPASAKAIPVKPAEISPDPSPKPTPTAFPVATASDVVLYLYRTDAGKWRGSYYIGSIRRALEGGMTLEEIEGRVTRELGELEQEATF